MQRFLLSLLIFMSCCLHVWAQDIGIIEKAQSIITQIDKEMTPDHRLELFHANVLLRNDSLIVRGETTVAAVYDSLRESLRRSFDVAIGDEIRVLPEASLGDKHYGIITLSTGHLRREPDNDYEMISQGILGEPVTVFKKQGMFSLIKLSDGYLGYMEESSIHFVNEAELKEWQYRAKVIYMQNFGEIYSEKKIDSYPIGDIVRGAVVAVIKKEGKWFRVQLPDGRTGFLQKSTVMDFEKFRKQPKPKPEELVHVARQFTGHPYLWGGLSTKGFDCSGFTKTIYRLYNIELPRDANMQVKVGMDVAFDSTFNSLQAGDLLFFGPSCETITHVGMYIGKMRFIHCDGLVKINSFNQMHREFSIYRLKNLRVVRRI